MPQPSYWTLCQNRAEGMTRAYNLAVEYYKGNRKYGVSYTISFWIGNKQIHKLRDYSPAILYEKLSAFDQGMMTAQHIRIIREG